jgi:serine/threonine-protein kinase
MAPEQAMGRPFDGRADLFALGLTLYEMLTGRRALQAPTDELLLRAAVDQQVEPPSRFNPEVPAALDAVVMRLLEKDPARRTATGAELRAQLLALEGAAAPFPRGQALMAQAARDALEQARRAVVEQQAADDVRTSQRLTMRA